MTTAHGCSDVIPRTCSFAISHQLFVMPEDAFKICGKLWPGNLGPVVLKEVDLSAMDWTLDRGHNGPLVAEVAVTGPSGKFFMELIDTWIRIAGFSVKQ